MISCVVVTHGQLASELVAAAEMIVGEIEHIIPVCIGWHDDVSEAREEIAKILGTLDATQGILILTDMFGGTPSNLAISFMDQYRVEVITGVNLPMIIKAASQADGEAAASLAQKICEKGKSNITVASQFLAES